MKKKVNENRLGRIGKLFLAESSKKGKKRQGKFSRSKPPGFHHTYVPKNSHGQKNKPISYTVLTTKTPSGTAQKPRTKRSHVWPSDAARTETWNGRPVPFGHTGGLDGESPRSSRSQVGKNTKSDLKWERLKSRLLAKKYKPSGETVEAPSVVADGKGNRANRRIAQRKRELGRPLRTTSMKESLAHIAYILAEDITPEQKAAIDAHGGGWKVRNLAKERARAIAWEKYSKEHGGFEAFERRQRLAAKRKTEPMKESFSHIAYILAEALGLGRGVGTDTQRAFKVGQAMADREYRDPSTGKANKARREKLKKAGHKSVSAGMASRSKELRGEEPKRPKKDL